MPNFLKTKKDENLWKQAKEQASKYENVKKGSDQYWAITNGIYQRMKSGTGGKKTATVSAKLDKSDYIKIAQRVANEYFADKTGLDDIIVKVALARDLNDHQIKSLCSTTNHLVHAAIMKEKEAEEDKYVDFEVARPEKIAEIISSMVEIADDIYGSPDDIFGVQTQKEADDQTSYGQFVNKTVRRGQVIQQNIKNIASAHAKVANELLMEVTKTDDQIEKLYRLIRQSVEAGKSLIVLRDVLGKAFGDANNFALIWGDILTKLIADNIIDMPPADKDRSDGVGNIQNWSPNASSPIVVAAVDIDRRLNKTDELEKILLGLEKMAAETRSDLVEIFVLEKKAVIGAAVKGIGSWVVKTVGKKGVQKGVSATAVNVKKKGSSKLMNTVFMGMEATPAFKKTTKIKRNLL